MIPIVYENCIFFRRFHVDFAHLSVSKSMIFTPIIFTHLIYITHTCINFVSKMHNFFKIALKSKWSHHFSNIGWEVSIWQLMIQTCQRKEKSPWTLVNKMQHKNDVHLFLLHVSEIYLSFEWLFTFWRIYIVILDLNKFLGEIVKSLILTFLIRKMIRPLFFKTMHHFAIIV